MSARRRRYALVVLLVGAVWWAAWTCPAATTVTIVNNSPRQARWGTGYFVTIEDPSGKRTELAISRSLSEVLSIGVELEGRMGRSWMELSIPGSDDRAPVRILFDVER